MTPALRAVDLCRRFGATSALDHVSLELEAGRVRAILGTNGAGKSTLLHVLGGLVRCDSGSLELGGRTYAPSSPSDALRKGVQIIAQEPAVVADLTVEANVMLGAERSRGGFMRRSLQRSLASTALARLGYGWLDLDLYGRDLSLPLRHVVAFARALVLEARVVVLDEPTSALTSEESARVISVVRELAAQGTAVLYVTHFLDEVARASDDWTVLRDGRVAAEGPSAGIDVDTLVRHMTGKRAQERLSARPCAPGDVVLTVTGLSGEVSPREVDLTVRRGEVLGLFGLAGAGRSSLLRAILGAIERTRGAVRVGSNLPLEPGPQAGVRARLSLLSEERRIEDTLPKASVLDNVALSRLEPFARAGFVAAPRLEAAVRAALARVQAAHVDPAAPIEELSGGTQQRVALARLVHARPDVYLLDEPTRGIDLATKGEIHALIRALASEGSAVMISSSSLDELFAVCDRLAVMCRGKLADVRALSSWTRADVLAQAARDGAAA